MQVPSGWTGKRRDADSTTESQGRAVREGMSRCADMVRLKAQDCLPACLPHGPAYLVSRVRQLVPPRQKH